MSNRFWKIFFIVLTFIVLSSISMMTFENISHVTLLAGMMALFLGLGAAVFYLWDMSKKPFHRLYIVSYLLTGLSVFVPVIGVYSGEGFVEYGFPVPWLAIYEPFARIDIAAIGLIFNFFFFYWILRLVRKLWLKFPIGVKKSAY
ncbi:hypothetical protein [Salipaludibacillus aurantiacus]|uniref:Uncharacterized protein n=1 Tax=Salipaludibacillus aurantiacus TaxID=1601833 RepID=A0A1H9Q3Z0_9BACI|nr:hypothetical protein [Salipaludibacillus aurantiacus]SER54583.1 hypothetical protein SAMN05518684_10214 [Salipaludibacillus aurantiacus]